MARRARQQGNDGRLATQQSVNAAIKSICDIMRRTRAQAIAEAVYDLKAVNPHAKRDVDTRTPEELLDLIEAKGREVAEAIAALRAIGRR